MSRYYVERDARCWFVYDRREPYNRTECVAVCRDADTAFRIRGLLNADEDEKRLTPSVLPRYRPTQ